jgi:hypothetical protein
VKRTNLKQEHREEEEERTKLKRERAESEKKIERRAKKTQ